MSGPPDVAPRRDGHDGFDELAVGWALAALEPEDETLFAAHLPGCTRCLGTVAETTEVMGALAADLPDLAPPDRLRQRLRSAVQDTEQVPPPSEPPVRPASAAGAEAGRRRTDVPAPASPDHLEPLPLARAEPQTPWRRVLPNALAAAAVAAILALGTWNVVLSEARDQAQTAAAEQAEMVNALLTPGRAAIAALSDEDGTPVATVVARAGRLQVVTHGLDVNDADERTYVVWGTGGQSPVPLGTFDVVSDRMDLRTVGSAPTGLDDHTGYGISLEAGRQPPSAPTEVVATGEVTR